MNYTDLFVYMRAEVTLALLIVLLFLYDLFAGERARRCFTAVVCILLAVEAVVALLPGEAGRSSAGCSATNRCTAS